MAARASHAKTSSLALNRRLVPGQAPPIAAMNAEAARSNIDTKLQLLLDLSKSAVALESGEPWPAHIPLSVRSFNAWASDSLPAPLNKTAAPFHRNSLRSLKRNADLLEILQCCFADADAEREKARKKANKKSESLARMRCKLSTAIALREIAEAALIRSRLQINALREDIARLEAALRSTEAKSKEIISNLERDLADSERNKSGMVAALAVVNPLRRL